MNGGYVHEYLILEGLEHRARLIGASTRRQVMAGSTRADGFIDLVIEHRKVRIAVEAELTPRRVSSDVQKARALGVDELWIVVPNSRVARQVKRELRKCLYHKNNISIFVLTLGGAKQRVYELIF